jgi:hypothetical protein
MFAPENVDGDTHADQRHTRATGGVQAISRELNISETDAAKGAAALAPAILGGFKKQAQAQTSGVDGLGALLGQLGGGSLLDNVIAPQPTDVTRGNDVLGQIFGSRDVSRTVAENAAAQTGVDQNVLKRMLPMVAMMLAGYMARQHAGTSGTSPSAGGLGGLVGGLLGGARGGAGGGLSSMLDMNHDGNPLDDILRMAARRT